MKKDTFDRARMEILNYIITFSTYKAYDGKVWTTGSDAYFVNSNYNPPIGSLCMLQSAPFSKWYLSWLIEKDGEKFLLQSIEDQSICWWRKVSFSDMLNFYDEAVRNEPVSKNPKTKEDKDLKL